MFNTSISRAFASAYQKTFKNWRILKGDIVSVNTGLEKGKVGEVLKVYRKINKVMVQNVFPTSRRQVNKEEGQEKVEGYRKIHVSNVNLVDPESGKPTRVRFAFLADGSKVRVSKKSGSIIPKPSKELDTYEARFKDKVDGPLDTTAARVLEVTYLGEDFATVRKQFMAHITKKEEVERLLVFDK